MPLTFDFPLDQLGAYRGTNPRPVDFDRFWDAGVSDMRQIDPEVEIVPADFEAPFARCSHLYFTGIGNARIHAKLMEPKNPQPSHPAILMFHGYTADSGDWLDKLGYVAAGYTVAAMDCRGQGGLSQDTGGVSGNTHHGHIIRGLKEAVEGKPEKLLFRNIFLDTAQLAKIIMERPGVDANRVGATGLSQGGALTVACASLEPRIRRVAPIFPFLSDYKRVWQMDQAQQAYAELKEYFRRFDPLHRTEDAVFEKLGYIDIQHMAERIRGDVLWAVSLMDTICPPSTQFAAYNKIRAPKEMITYPDFGHEGLPGHPDRIFQFMMGL